MAILISTIVDAEINATAQSVYMAILISTIVDLSTLRTPVVSLYGHFNFYYCRFDLNQF